MEEQELEQSPILRKIHAGVHSIVSGFYDHFMIEESNHITLGAGNPLGNRMQMDEDYQNKYGNLAKTFLFSQTVFSSGQC